MSFEDLKKEIDEIKKLQEQEIENRKKLAKALLDLSKRLDEHIGGGLTLDDIQKCMERVQQLVGILEGAGIIGRGEGQGGMLASLLAQMLKQQQSVQQPEIEKTKVDSKRLKKMLEEDEDEDESEE